MIMYPRSKERGNSEKSIGFSRYSFGLMPIALGGAFRHRQLEHCVIGARDCRAF